MRTLLHIIFGIAVFLMPQLCLGQAQWQMIHPYPTNEDLYTVYFPSAELGFIVGDYGTILRSADGGESWELLSSGTTSPLTSVHFFDNYLGIVVGEHGTILRTTDGGDTWTPQPSLTTSRLNGVSFLSKQDSDIVFAVGSFTTFLRSIDKGLTWTQVDIGLSGRSDMSDITFTAAGWGAISGFAFQLFSFDGGANWIYHRREYTGLSRISAVTPHSFSSTGLYYTLRQYWGVYFAEDSAKTYRQVLQDSSPLRGNHFINERTGYAVGTNIHRTDDGGVTWTKQLEKEFPWGFWDVFFTDSLNGTVIGTAGVLLRTNDAGATWRNLSESRPTYFRIGVANSGVVYAGGYRGLAVTTDGGRDWTWRATGRRDHLYQITTIKDSVLIALESAFASILRSTDGGVEWEQRHFRELVSPLVDVLFVDDDRGIAVGRYGYMVVTTDAGLSWTATNEGLSSSDWIALDCLRENATVTLFALNASDSIWYSRDAGETWRYWSMLPAGEYFDIAILDQNVAFVVGKSMMLKTIDAGASWQTVETGDVHYLRRVLIQRFENATFILSCGAFGVILHSSDQGVTWLRHTTPTRHQIHDVRFLDTLNGIAVGDPGVLLRTINGGLTWVEDKRPSPAFVHLGQSYPNPATSNVTIPITLTAPGHVSLTVHDILGRKVATLLDERQEAGKRNVSFNAGGLLPGVYFYILRTAGGSESRSMLLLRP